MSHKERSDKAWRMALVMESLGLKPDIQAKQIISTGKVPSNAKFKPSKEVF